MKACTDTYNAGQYVIRIGKIPEAGCELAVAASIWSVYWINYSLTNSGAGTVNKPNKLLAELNSL